MINHNLLKKMPGVKRVARHWKQWKFFCWLLEQADEEGKAEVSINDYAAQNKVPRTTVQSWLTSLLFRPLLRAERVGFITTIFICNYDSYKSAGVITSSKIRQRFVKDSSIEGNIDEKIDEIQKENLPPVPPIKEKEVTTLQEEEEESADAFFLSGLSDLSDESTSLEYRQKEFWQKCLDIMRKHPEYPLEKVQSFFRHWAQVNRETGLMMFEEKLYWWTPYFLERYIRYGHRLDEMHQARIEAIKSRGGGRPKTPTTAEIKRKEAALEAEKQEKDRQLGEDLRAGFNGTSHEDAMCDPQYWLACGVDERDSYLRAKRNPRYLAAFNKAKEIAKQNSEKFNFRKYAKVL